MRPDHVSSIAQTLMSTRPVGRNRSRSTSSVMSVGTLEALFGHAVQIAPSGGITSRARSTLARRSPARVAKHNAMSTPIRDLRDTEAPAGFPTRRLSKPRGAPISQTFESSVIRVSGHLLSVSRPRGEACRGQSDVDCRRMARTRIGTSTVAPHEHLADAGVLSGSTSTPPATRPRSATTPTPMPVAGS